MTLSISPMLIHGPNTYIPNLEMPAIRTPVSKAEIGSRIDAEIIEPILESEDLSTVLQGKWPVFKEWRDSIVKSATGDIPVNLGDLFRQEDTIARKTKGRNPLCVRQLKAFMGQASVGRDTDQENRP